MKLEKTNDFLLKSNLPVGMKAMLLQINIAPVTGLATDHVVQSLISFWIQGNHSILFLKSPTRRLCFPPAAVLFSSIIQPPSSCTVCLEAPYLSFLTKTFKLSMTSTVTVKHTEYSLTPAYAFTDYKAQGQTMQSTHCRSCKAPTETLPRD